MTAPTVSPNRRALRLRPYRRTLRFGKGWRTQMAVHENPRLRSDAQRNREHILQVAHDAFAESGATSLNEIAKRAGVGPGTLYRHFPTREALILAVYRRDIQRLVDSVDDLLRT